MSTIQNIAYCFGERVRMAQKMNSFEFNESVEGRVVCCGIDGGRIRIRKNKRGRKTKKNRSHYHTDWKEPKLLIIYVVNEEGRRDRQFCPIIDGTMKGPDAVFNLMHYYLVKLNITKADKIVFTADGAQWIWDRVGSLMASLKLKEDQIHLTLDFYHAVQHLNKIAKLCRKWSEKERKAWMNRQRRYLLKGKVDQMINEIRSLCKGRNSRSIRTELNYFIKHRYHMNYFSNLAKNLPIGSGAVESAVRRVINLRAKGPGIFWKKENAELIILMRGYYKSGRWDQLKNMSLSVGLVIS